MDAQKICEIPIDFSMLPQEEDIDPWTRIEIPSRAWYNYIESLEPSEFDVEDSYGYDCTNLEVDPAVDFHVSPSLSFTITRLRLKDGRRFYLKVTEVRLIDINNGVMHFFKPHHFKIGKATSGLNLQYKTVIPLLEKCGVVELLGVNVNSLFFGSSHGATIHEIVKRPDYVRFNHK